MIKETKKSPTIRFRRFIDDWEQRSFGDIFEERSEKNHAKLPPLTIMQGVGTVRRDETGRELIYDKNSLINYKLVKRNDFIVHLRSFEGGLEKSNLDGIVSPAYHVFCGRKINPEFYYSFFRSDEFINHKLVPFVYGIRDGRSIDISGMKMIQIPYPSLDEQNCIGELIGKLNAAISLYQSKLEQQKKLKKYFLQNMFPAKGEKVPKIRLKGFTGDWEQRKFGEIAEYKKGPFGSALKKEFFIPDSDISIKVYEQQNAINKDWTLSRYYISQEYAQKLKAFEVHSGDIIVSCAGTIGEIYELPAQSRPGIINQALMRIRVNKDIVCKDIFKLAFSNMIDSLSREFSNGSAIKNIPPFADLKPMKVLLPDKTEQKLIGDFFTDIDKTITLHQRKLNQFQTMKKFMLQNLFI